MRRIGPWNLLIPVDAYSAYAMIIGQRRAVPEFSASLPAARQARLFRNDCSRAVRIPADWEPPGDRAAIRRDRERLILEPLRPRGLLGLLSS